MTYKRHSATSAMILAVTLAVSIALMIGACEPRPADKNNKKSNETSADKTPEARDDSKTNSAAKESAPAAKAEPDPARVQGPLVAGSFYPGDKAELEAMIGKFLAEAPEPEGGLPGKPVGFMVPHAGYVYSGPVAAHAYKILAKTRPRRVVIMGPSHRVPLSGVYVMDMDAYRTPLGLATVGAEAARQLAGARPWISRDARYYTAEHSIEVQIPFLQAAIGGDFEILPIMIGAIGGGQARDLAELLSELFPGGDTLFIASTDLSHGNYPPYKGSGDIRPVDLKTCELVEAMDTEAIARGVKDNSRPMCGGLPVLTLMELFKLRGGGEVRLLKYADSGDATGDRERVVGYGAIGFFAKDRSGEKGGVDMGERESSEYLSRDEKRRLLGIARSAAEAAVRGEDIPDFDIEEGKLKDKGAAFVTLKNRGSLRGCIGSIVAVEPLYECVRRRAVDAAVHDSRFFMNPIGPDELGDIEIEISVLTPPEPSSPDEVEVGRHGVILELGGRRGVFLPQVPIEQGWDREQYLSHLCRKAGIADPGCYLRKEARLATFEAVVFHE